MADNSTDFIPTLSGEAEINFPIFERLIPSPALKIFSTETGNFPTAGISPKSTLAIA